MILYNVTVKVDVEVHQQWLEWMRLKHIPEVMATGKFSEFRICRLLHEEPDGVTYAVQYFSPDLETLQRYQQEDAQRLQEEHAMLFSGRYAAFRTAMEVL